MEEYIQRYIAEHPHLQEFTETDLYGVACDYTSHLPTSDLLPMIPPNTLVLQERSINFAALINLLAAKELSHSDTLLNFGNQILKARAKTYTISFNLEAESVEAVQSILDSVQSYLLSQAFPANIDFNSLYYMEKN